MSLSTGQIMAIAQAIRWAIREFLAARKKDAAELTEREFEVLEKDLRRRIMEATGSDRERWDRVIGRLEEIDDA